MDTEKTTLIVIAAAAAITVASRFHQNCGGQTADEAGRAVKRLAHLTQTHQELRLGRRALRRGQAEVCAEVFARLDRLDARMAELVETGAEVRSLFRRQAGAVAGAYAALGAESNGLSELRRLREVRRTEA